jgi:hypothetical protein
MLGNCPLDFDELTAAMFTTHSPRAISFSSRYLARKVLGEPLRLPPARGHGQAHGELRARGRLPLR